MNRTCKYKHCRRTFAADTARQDYCSSRCRRAEYERTHPERARQIPLFKNNRIDEAFSEWAHANPQIVQTALRCAQERKRAGVDSMSVKEVFERLRRDGIKVNDHYTSRLARRLVELDPSLAGMFETRRLRAK